MTLGKQKYFTLISQDDDTIFCIVKSIPVNTLDDVVSTIHLSDDWLKYRNINIDEKIQIMNFQLFGKEILEFEGTEQEWLKDVDNNFQLRFKEFIDAKQAKTEESGLDKFYFKSGQHYQLLEDKLQDFCDEYNFTLTK